MEIVNHAYPDTTWEFKERIKNFQKELDARNLDVVLIHSNEADFANVRYLSDYWPAFESAGVVIPRDNVTYLHQVLLSCKVKM